ncbi:MAG TPA: hypothetical protein VGX68_19580 [Thermoanaerobaculia bacterium]|nr:hypothetical protein [Thermoanaerobaculia bacterium]
MVFKIQNETTEAALCVGMVAALVWGVGLSLYGLQQGAEKISWLAWSMQLIGGILVCLLVPPAYVRGRQWILERIHRPGQPP